MTKRKQCSSTKSKPEPMTSPVSIDMTSSKPQGLVMRISDHVTPPITTTEPKYSTTESIQANIDVIKSHKLVIIFISLIMLYYSLPV